MESKTITFTFPADAWAGIVQSLTEGAYQHLIRNPAFDGQDQTVPMQIENPKSQEEAATDVVLQFVAERFKNWASRAQFAPVQAKIQEAVAERAVQVISATTVKVE